MPDSRRSPADLPPYFGEGELSGLWPREKVPTREELLWKPWDELNKSALLQDQVGKLLSMCSSSCLPGGGSNTELALRCLHCCHGNTMATLEMLLFSQDLPTGDYHYSGCDFWTTAEKSVFSEALRTYGKDFALIAKMMRTKTVSQCVEFYYLSKKLLDKQKKQKEEEYKDRDVALQKGVTPIFQPVDRQLALEEAVPAPSLASFFPCKLCGKMFYKIKSRNAHMKIHRQPQEDWTDRHLRHQILTQRLGLSHPTNLMPNPGSNLLQPQAPALTFSHSGHAPSTKSNADNAHNSVTNSNPAAQSNTSILDAIVYSNNAPPASQKIPINNAEGDVSNRREPPTVLPFHQSWGSIGHPSDLGTFFCIPDGKEYLGTGSADGKELSSWQ
ncbi:zinc finger protein 541-like [Xenentodon cancila]